MTIALELLSPTECSLQQNWLFNDETVIRIGRANDNHISLDNSAISEYHTMLWGYDNEWKIVNLSCNGTYLDNKPVTHALLRHGAIIRLATSGPWLRFRYLASEATISGNLDGKSGDTRSDRFDPATVRPYNGVCY